MIDFELKKNGSSRLNEQHKKKIVTSNIKGMLQYRNPILLAFYSLNNLIRRNELSCLLFYQKN